MAINPSTSYPGKIDITSDPAGYPYGKGQNVSAPAAGDGTPWEILIVNDILGLQQAILDAGGVVPSGTPDKVGASDYLTALANIFEAVFSKNTAFNKDFGVSAGEIMAIASALANSSILETDGSGEVVTATKNTAYNKDIGTTAGTVAAGDDSRFAAAAGGWDYDSGWVADWASVPQNFNHALNEVDPRIIQIQMRDGNNVPIVFSASAPVTEHDGGTYTEGYGPQVTLVDANNIIVQKQQVTGGNPEFWLPSRFAVAPNGWAGLQPTELRILIEA